jgi:hypothetical protein
MLSFVLRIRSQLEQLNRFFMKTAERAMQTADLVVRGQLDYSMLLKQLFDIGGRMRGGEDPLERDYFNMRKMIVVSTSAGNLFNSISCMEIFLRTNHFYRHSARPEQ